MTAGDEPVDTILLMMPGAPNLYPGVTKLPIGHLQVVVHIVGCLIATLKYAIGLPVQAQAVNMFTKMAKAQRGIHSYQTQAITFVIFGQERVKDTVESYDPAPAQHFIL